jgi:hypothetical protein
MSLMYEALRPKSSAEHGTGFSAHRSHVAAARYAEELNSVSSHTSAQRRSPALAWSAGVLVLLVAFSFLVLMQEDRVSGLSRGATTSTAKDSSKAVHSVAIPATQQANLRNELPALAMSPAPLFIPSGGQFKPLPETVKRSAAVASAVPQKITEEKSSQVEKSTGIQNTSQKKPPELPKEGLTRKPEQLLVNLDTAAKTQDKETVTAVSVPSTDALSLADHFDAMNRELSKGAKLQAGTHLKAIQAVLAPTSISRLRAEGWYEYHAGSLDASKAIYRKILNRIPGDENATSVLQAIENKSGSNGTIR